MNSSNNKRTKKSRKEKKKDPYIISFAEKDVRKQRTSIVDGP